MCHKNHVCFFLLPSHTLSLTHRCAGIFSSSIKNNILFGKDHNHKLLQRVINATALATVSHFTNHLTLILTSVGSGSTSSWHQHSRRWSRCHALRGELDDTITALIVAVRRDRRHGWTWHEPCIVMQTSICWMIHCLLWTWKCRSISFRSECSTTTMMMMRVCLLDPSRSILVTRSVFWSHIRFSSCKMRRRSLCWRT